MKYILIILHKSKRAKTIIDRENGLDIANFFVSELKFPFSSNSQKVHFRSTVGESPRREIEIRGEVFHEIQSFSVLTFNQ